ncbi:MAG: hypothetical protein ACKVOO_05850 [Burkholderiaceae bacterium]
MNLSKLIKLIVLLLLCGIAFRYSFVNIKSSEPHSCDPVQSRIAKFRVDVTVSRSTNKSYLLDERGITCYYSEPSECPANSILEKESQKNLLVTEVICNGNKGSITIINKLESLSGDKIFYSQQSLKEWIIKAKRFDDYLSFLIR